MEKNSARAEEELCISVNAKDANVTDEFEADMGRIFDSAGSLRLSRQFLPDKEV